MQKKRARRPQLRTLICPSCGKYGSLKPILWGMPEEDFNYDKFASGGCCVPSAWPPDSRCSACYQDCYRDEVSGYAVCGGFSPLTDENEQSLSARS